MKTDFYTKAVLTVIAVCLSILLLTQLEIIPIAHAVPSKTQYNPSIQYGLVPLNEDGSINVHIKSNSSVIDVDLVDISTSDELDVNIDEVGGYSTYGKVPVEVK